MLSQVLPDPIPGDVAILTTMEGLQALMDFDNPVHRGKPSLDLSRPRLSLRRHQLRPLAPGSTRASIKTRTKIRWANCRGGGPKTDLGIVLWERCHWVSLLLWSEVSGGSSRSQPRPRLLKRKRTQWKRLPGE
ncbi:hypothetical protein GQ600_9713 [Phytophthora cactorum]|nr:hypothetical protein GQ600_9713 [Phytophthora cactorum]